MSGRDRPTLPLSQIARPVLMTRLGMVAERLARAFWPCWTLLLISISTIALGIPRHLPLEAFWMGAVAAVLGLVWTGALGMRRFAIPSREEAIERLDRTLAGRPLAALTDTQVIGAADTASRAVWQAHLQRMTSRLRDARPVPPDLSLVRLDRYGLRYVALAVFVLAVVFGSLRFGEVTDSVAGGQPALAVGPSWEGWIQPPAYTGRPGLYLADLNAASVQVPVGSRVEIRLYGDVGALGVAESVSGETAGANDAAATGVHGFDIVQAGRIEITGASGAAWSIALTPDAAPEIALDGPLRRAASGEMTQAFAATDDYGVVSGDATVTLDLARVDRRYGLAADPEPREPISLALPLPVAGDRREIAGELVEDFSKHPWANLPVSLTLGAEDAAGNTGATEPVDLEALPGRRFFDPLAKALIEQRRDILWSRENAPRVAQLLRAISHNPDDVFRSESDYLRTRFIARQIEAALPDGLSAEARDEIAEALWQLALRIEEGDLSDAMAELRRAQERLAEAMRNGASDEEIAQLMQDLREAMQDYMRQLAEQMQSEDAPQDMADAREITGQQLQDMLDQLQQLMEQGRMAEAQALLEQLNRMMQNLQMAQGSGQGQPGPGQQAMRDLQETLRDQQELSDESFQGLQGQGQQPGEGQQQGQQGQGQQGQQGLGGQPGQGQPGGQGGTAQDGDGQGLGAQLAERQEQLRRELQRQRDGLPGTGEGSQEARRSLDEAGRAMEDAEGALRDNDLAGAMDSQSEAMDRLRDGIQSLGEELARQQQQGNGQPGQALGQAGPNSQRDPLGRDSGGDGEFGTRENLLQDEDVYRRARDLLDEIRRRSSDQTRPEDELDYLRRLLDRF